MYGLSMKSELSSRSREAGIDRPYINSALTSGISNKSLYFVKNCIDYNALL